MQSFWWLKLPEVLVNFTLQKYDLYCHLIDPRVPAFSRCDDKARCRGGAAAVARHNKPDFDDIWSN